MYEKELKSGYKLYFGEELNLENPQTFNEKIQGLKLYDSTPLKGKLADKYESREGLINELGYDYSIPIIGVGDKFDDIDFSTLPNKFVLKATHGSGWNIVVSNKSELNRKDAKQKFDKGLATDYSFVSGYELHYGFIKPRIIAEEYISDNPIDYRFYCFNGTPKDVGVDMYSGTPNHRRTIFDLDGNELDVICRGPKIDIKIDKPKNFNLMIDIAKSVSNYFTFVRVDFYEIDDKLYIGELTFTPMSGIGHYNPESYNLLQGSGLDLKKGS